MQSDSNYSHSNHLLTYVTEAARWSREIIQFLQWPRQIWSCPDEHRYFSARILSAISRGLDFGKVKTDSQPIVKHCQVFVGAFAVDQIGMLITNDNKIKIGRHGADAELHILFGNLQQAELMRRQLEHVVTVGWHLYAKFIPMANNSWIFSILAIRDNQGGYALFDKSFTEADEDLRLWLARSLRQKIVAQADVVKDLILTRAGTNRLVRLPFSSQRNSAIRVSYPHAELSMKVGFYVCSLATIGGLERWVISMISSLKKLGIEGYVISLSEEKPSEEFGPSLTNNYVSLNGDAKALSSILSEIGIEIVLVNHVYDGLNTINSSIRIYEVIHNIYFWQKNNHQLRYLRNRFEACITISAVVTEYSQKFLQINSSKIIEIPHGLDRIGLVKPIKKPSFSKKNATDIRIIQVANLYPQKNTLALIMAFEHAFGGRNDIHLDIIGGFNEEVFVSKIRSYISDNNLKNNITLHGSVDRRAVSKLYSKASFFCFPSLYEGYGLAILEAMYYGLPIIVSNTGHAANLASFSNGIIVPIASSLENLDENSALAYALSPTDNDIKILANALIQIVENYEHYKDGADKACASLQRNALIDHTALKYAEIFYQSVI